MDWVFYNRDLRHVRVKQQKVLVIGLINNFNTASSLFNVMRIWSDFILSETKTRNLLPFSYTFQDPLSRSTVCFTEIIYTTPTTTKFIDHWWVTSFSLVFAQYESFAVWWVTRTFTPTSFLKKCLSFWKHPNTFLIPVSAGYRKVI